MYNQVLVCVDGGKIGVENKIIASRLVCAKEMYTF